MATNRKIDSPGIQISEIDLSLRPVQTTATTIFVPGFAPRGPINDPIPVASLSEFEQIYGQPTNGAERYFYNTVKASLQSPANILVSRLPYGASAAVDSNTVGLLAYPAYYIDTSSSNTAAASLTAGASQTFSQSTSGTYLIGAPVHYALTKSQYNDFLNGSLFTYSNNCTGALTSSLASLGNAAIIIANPSVTNINSLYEGYYIGIVDNTNLNPATDFDTITKIKSLTTSAAYVSGSSYLTVPSQRYGFALSAAYTDGAADSSLSQVLETAIVGYDVYADRSYDDVLIIGLFKLRQSVFSSTSIQLGYTLEEGYVGSLDSKRQINNVKGGPAESFFLETVATYSSRKVGVNLYY